MRRLVFCILLSLISVSILFGAITDLRVWFYNGEHKTTFDLSSAFYVPTYGTKYGKDSPSEGTYDRTKNGIGNAGYAFCNHDMTLTVTTMNGKFVSQSDPTKYRDFYIALVPRYRTHTGASDDSTYTYDFFENKNHALTERLPNTKETNTLTVKGPHFSYIQDSYFDVDDYTAYLNDQGITDPSEISSMIAQNMAKMSSDPDDSLGCIRFWWDILICFDPLTSEDLTHLAENDDYIARIQYTWTCSREGQCNTNHNFSGYIELRGYYKDDNHVSDNVFVVVTPDVNASRLNLDKMIIDKAQGSADQEVVISTLSITSPAAKNGTSTYTNHVKFFISASPDYQDDTKSFQFVRYYPATGNVAIPYVLKIYDNNGNLLQKENGTPAVYTGSESYQGKNNVTSKAAILRLSKNGNSYPGFIVDGGERLGNKTQQLAFNGYVTISVTVPEGYYTSGGYNNANNNDFSGIYRSYVYYHVVWEQ